MQEENKLLYQTQQPDEQLLDFVKCFWSVKHDSAERRVVTILPDGYFDILFVSVNGQPFSCSLLGLSTQPVTYNMPRQASVSAISFKLLAVEYLLKTGIASIIDKGQNLPGNLWEVDKDGLSDFAGFVDLMNIKLIANISDSIDERKRKLFDILYSSNGSIKVDKMSAEIFWNSRQINRYFRSRFGLSLKAYCDILRFRASFQHLKEGGLFPEEGYFDQSHFVKEVKKFAATSPKFLAANKNDRFIQLSTLLTP